MATVLLDIYNNPGMQLQLFLKELYPIGTVDRCFISRIDETLLAEDELTELIYASCLNYLVRRLICSAEYLKRKFEPEYYGTTRYVNELRKLINTQLEIAKRDREKLLSVLMLCVQQRGRTITQRKKDDLKRKARERGWRCFFCGRSMEFTRDNQPTSATVDHLWPLSLGGISEAENLVVCCKSCNDAKTDHIDKSDYHYEAICLVTDKNDDSFGSDFNRQYRMAVLARANYRCMFCQTPASYVGELSFSRLNSNDSWHFLNIGAYCGEHASE